MGSPPGTLTSSCACVDGMINFTINFDVPTRALVNRGAPSACVVVTNTSTRRGELELIGAAVDLSLLPGGIDHDHINIPVGTTRLTAAQLANVGFHNIDDVGQFGTGCGTDPGIAAH